MPEWRDEIRGRLAKLKLELRREDDIVEELAQHLEDRYQELRAGGATREEAYCAVLAEFSDSDLLARELRRVERIATPQPIVLGAGRRNMIADLWQDLHYGFRMLRKNPGFAAIAVLTLALGIGANTAIFSALDALMLRPLPVRNPEQLVMLSRAFPTGKQPNFSYQNYERFRALQDVFVDAAAIANQDRSNVMVNEVGSRVDEGQVRVSLVTGNYFSVLGVQAAVGRTFTEEDDRVQGGNPVTVISYGYWERMFGLDQNVAGRTLTLNGTTYTILGVTPRGFAGEWVGRPTDLWFPLAMLYQVMPEIPPGQRGGLMSYRIVARLQPGVRLEQARAAGQVANQQLLTEAAGPNPTPQQMQQSAQTLLEVDPAARGYSPQRESFAPPLKILMIIVGAVLAVACANIANLLLARSAARQREIAVRLALGAGRGRIVRQLLTESLLLATMGGALGLLFSVWGTNTLSALVRSGPVGGAISGLTSIDLDLRVDGRILAFTAALCLLTGILFGLAPAFRSSKVSLALALAGRGADSAGAGSKFSLRKLLVISQVAVSLVLLVETGLFVRTLRNLQAEDLGIEREHLLLVWTQPGQIGRQGLAMNEKGRELATFYQMTQERLSALPGVISASPSTYGLMTGRAGGPPVTVEGYALKPDENPTAQFEIVGPGFFQTVGQPLLVGRDFTARDAETAPPVVIINQRLARYFFGDDNPIGKRFQVRLGNAPLLEIVGVVKDTKQNSPRDQEQMIFYYPYRQQIGLRLMRMCMAVRTAGNPARMAAGIRQELRDIAPSLPVLKIDTIEEQLNDVLFQERLITTLSSFFGALAALLACLGLYGVVSYSVARRTNEIGIRLALGATPGGVLRMVLKESLALVLVGVVIGIPVTLAATRLISARLFGVSATDPLTMAVAATLLIAVAALAVYLPARRAAQVDPMIALRYE